LGLFSLIKNLKCILRDCMIDKTKQKFLDAALKLFAEKGYIGATTLAISEEAGFSEKTLFRKFKTKKNLYDKVLAKNTEKMEKEFASIFENLEYENSRDILENFVRSLAKTGWNNFEFIFLSTTHKSPLFEPMMSANMDFLGKFLEETIGNEKINYRILGVTISSFIFLITVERHFGRTIIDFDVALDEFIENLLLYIE